MRAWDEGDELLRARAERRRRGGRGDAPRRSSEQGIDLDPPAPGHHRHGDLEHASDHAHPHAHSDPGERPVVGIVGAGRRRHGARRRARPGRLARRRRRVARSRPAASGSASASARRARVRRGRRARRRRRARDPRGPRRRGRASVAASLRLYAGQAIVHTSGAARRGGAAPGPGRRDPGGRVPPARRVRRPRPGARGPPRARRSPSRGTTTSRRTSPTWPRRSAASPVRLPPGSKAAYHAAAVLAAGGVMALLDTIREIAAVMGLDEAGALRDLPPAPRADGRERPGPGHRAGADRAGHPRRRRARSRRTSRRSRRAPRTRSPVYRALLARVGRHRRTSGARCHRKRPNVSAPHLQATRDAVRCGHAAQHRGPLRGVAGALRPPLDPGPRAATRAAPGVRRSSRPPAAGPCCAARTSDR